VYPVAHLWTVRDEATIAAAMMTPPHNLVVARPARHDALRFAAQGIHAAGVTIPGVVGALPEVDVFAEAWERATGSRHRPRMRQGIYAASSVVIPEGVGGEMRFATVKDKPLILAWTTAFQQEAAPPDAPRGNLDELIERRLVSRSAGIALWEDEGKPVSLCGYGGRTRHGTRIGPVYTPPELRGRGYASALVARVTAQLLASGVLSASSTQTWPIQRRTGST
jgi:uncharacterized protein